MAVQGSQSCHLYGKTESKSATGTLFSCVSSPALPAVCLLVIFVLLYLGDVASFGSRSLRQTAGSISLEITRSWPLTSASSGHGQLRFFPAKMLTHKGAAAPSAAQHATQTAAAGSPQQMQNVTYSLRLPTGELVPLVDPQDKVEIARKTATLGGHFDYYQKDFVERNVSSLKLKRGP